MAGHSKWANIQHRKNRQDARRGRLFAKLIREVTVAARLGGPESGSNPRLRLALEQASLHNVPKDTLQRAVQRGNGAQDGRDLEELLLEAFGPGGAAMLIESLTDNHTRAVAEVRHCLSKGGGKLVGGGDVVRLFRRTGLLQMAPGVQEEQVLETVLEYGAEDLLTEDGRVLVYIDLNDLQAARDSLEAAGLHTAEAECLFRARETVALEAAPAQRLADLAEALEDLEDVQRVYSNGCPSAHGAAFPGP